MLVVGLTGGPATGKSTVAAMFAKKGAQLIDADRIVDRLLAPSGACYAKVCGTFGRDILSGGRVDKKKLAGLVFKNRRKLKQLEAIIHPEVRRVIWKELRTLDTGKAGEVTILDIPLLFETGWDKHVDTTIVVKTSAGVQEARALKKWPVGKAEFLRRKKAQWPLKSKIRSADFIIDNNGNLNKTIKQVEELWQKLTQEKKVKKPAKRKKGKA